MMPHFNEDDPTAPCRPTVYGAAYSTYVRTVLLTLEEKHIPYDLVEVDVFAPGGPSADYLEINPFGRIPSFELDGFRLYEAVPIARYIDETFDSPKLQPTCTRRRARMNQVLNILDSDAYESLVWDIYVERSVARGRPPDEARITAAVCRARRILHVLADLMGVSEWMVGPGVTLADLHAAPMFDYLLQTPEGKDLLRSQPTLVNWWDHISQRPSMNATKVGPRSPPLPERSS